MRMIKKLMLMTMIMTELKMIIMIMVRSDDVLTQAEGKWHHGGRKLRLKSLEGGPGI